MLNLNKKHTEKLKKYGPIAVVAIAVLMTLFIAVQYKRLSYYEDTLKLLSFDKWVPIKHLPPNQSLSFSSQQVDVLDFFFLPQKTFSLHADTFGFVAIGNTTTPADVNIAFMGGSAVQCIYVSEEQRLANLITKHLSTTTKLTICGTNTATASAHVFHQLNLLNNVVLQHPPHYLLLYAEANDLHTILTYSSFNNASRFFDLLAYHTNQKNQQSAFPFFQNTFTYQPPLLALQAIDPSRLALPVEENTSPILAVYKTIFANCQANNIEPILILPPLNFEKLSYTWLKTNLPKLNWTAAQYQNYKTQWLGFHHKLKQLAGNENILAIDLNNTNLNLNDFYDPFNLNEQGTKKAAKTIVDTCIAHSIFTTSKPLRASPTPNHR